MWIKKEADDDENDGCDHERALFAKDSHPPQFKGTCYKCGKYDHRGIFCPDHANDTERQYIKEDRCWLSAEKGHKLFACKKFQAARVKLDRANLACDKEASNESINDLQF